MDRPRCQELSNGTLGLQLLDKAGKALKRTCAVNLGLLAQFNDARHIRVVALFHDFQLVSRIGKQQVAQRRRQRTMVVTRASVNLRWLNHIRRGRLICLKHALARHTVHIHALKILGDGNTIGKILGTGKGIRCDDVHILLIVGSLNLHVAARDAGTRGKASRRKRERYARVVLRGPDLAHTFVQLAPGVILSIVFTLRHGINDRAPKLDEHNPLGNVHSIGIVESRDHVKRLDNSRKAGAHVPLATRLARNRPRLGPRVVARDRIEQPGDIVGRFSDMPRVKERTALKARRRGCGGQSGPDTFKDAGEAVQATLNGKQGIDLILI